MVLKQIKTVEAARDAVVKKSSAQDESERMIRDLVQLCGIGAESATLLVREAFCRDFANRRSLGAYAGLTGTPFASGGMQREQGISKDGNRRLRALIVELAWFWLRFQPDSALAKWFRARVIGAKGRVAKIMIVAPDDASLAVYPFEITDHVHAKIAPRRQRWRAHPFGIKRFALDEGIEAGLAQKLLQTIVENMARRTRHLRPCHQEVALNLALTPHRHCRSRPKSFYDRQTESADDDFVNGLITCGPRTRNSCNRKNKFYEGERRPRIGYPGFVCPNLGEPR